MLPYTNGSKSVGWESAISTSLFSLAQFDPRFDTSQVGYVRLHGRNYENWFREKAVRDERYNYLYS